MNLEINEKYNNFVKIIENTENKEWLKQINESNYDNKSNYINTHLNKDYCSYEISSGYESIIEPLEVLSNNNKIINQNINSNSNKFLQNKKHSSNSKSKSKYSIDNDDEKLSLLEDEYFIKTIKNNSNLNNNSYKNTFDKEISNTINSEFKNLFMINENFTNINKFNDNKSSEIKGKLENIYNKIIVKNNNPKKLLGFQLENYIGSNELINKKTFDNKIKKISELIEYVFKESIRGWNYEDNLFILQIDKLKENLEKIEFVNILNSIKFGFIYRDFNDTKVYLDMDFSKYWIGYNIEFDNINQNPNKLIPIKYSIKNKVLFYCLKNLTNTNKFKKRISKWNYKFIKKTIQIHGNKNLIVDIILFVGIKIPDN